ncbi:condensation domain-containing protein, partial [Nocardia sp. NPDC058497]|uniref:condensation domain-containing protein n=1 Tax=Nocardia sp. NPDC058497 TaxID=3346529 RepID=UPI003667833A
MAQQLTPEIPFVIAQYVKFHGALDLDLLRAAIDAAAREFETVYLRLIEVDGQPFQIVDRGLEFHTEVLDFRDEGDPLSAVGEWLHRDVELPMDPVVDRLCKIAILYVSESDFRIYVKAHHIVLDGYGAMILMNRGAELYSAAVAGREAGGRPSTGLRTLYDKDQQYRASHRFTVDRDYWAQRMRDMPASSLNADVAPAARCLTEVAALSRTADEHLDGSESLRANLTVVVLAAFACYFSRQSGSHEVLVNIPVSARTTAQLKRSAGMLVNVVPLRIRIDPDEPLGEVIGRMQLELLGALRHQGCGIEDIRRSTGDTVSRFSVPLVNVMLFDQELRLETATGSLHALSRGPVGDRLISVYRSGTPTRTTIEFRANPNRYREDEVREQCTQIVELLDEFVTADPDTPLNLIHRASARAAERRYRDTAVLDYWKSALGGLSALPDLPTDGSRPTPTAGERSSVEFSVDTELHRAVVTLAAEQDVDSFVVLHAAVSMLVARLGRVDDVAIGTPVARTEQPGPEAEDILVLRTRVDAAATVADLLEHFDRVDRGAFEHADISSHRLASARGGGGGGAPPRSGGGGGEWWGPGPPPRAPA